MCVCVMRTRVYRKIEKERKYSKSIEMYIVNVPEYL